METIQELNQDNKEKIRAVNKKFQERLLEEPLSWRIKKYTLIGEPMSPNRRHSLSKPMLTPKRRLTSTSVLLLKYIS